VQKLISDRNIFDRDQSVNQYENRIRLLTEEKNRIHSSLTATINQKVPPSKKQSQIELLIVKSMQMNICLEQENQTVREQQIDIQALKNMVPFEIYNKTREIAMMQLNDFQSQQSRQGPLLEIIADQKREIREINYKLR